MPDIPETTRYGLREETIRLIQQVFASHPRIEQAILYGSRAKGTHRDASDIDLTLVGAMLTLSDSCTIAQELDDLLLPWKIDLSLRHTIDNPDLLDHIERVGREFYRRPA